MSSQGHPARAPAVMHGVEALALAALANLWRSLDKILPLWFALALFHALVHPHAFTPADDVWPLQAIVDNEASTLTGLVVTGLAAAVAVRIFLGRGREAWKPNAGLGAFVGIFVLLGVAPVVILMGLHPPGPSAPISELKDELARAAFGLAVGVAMFWISLRLSLWPIGRLLDDRRVTASQSWTLMRGAVMRYAGAVSSVVAPLILINAAVSVATAQWPAIHSAAMAPLNAAITLGAAAVAAEVYRNRMNLGG
jgi:hypothetical protein